MQRTLVQKTSGARNLRRRELLCFTGATVITALRGSSPGQWCSAGVLPSGFTQRPTRMAAVTAPSCVVRPQQTEGPYFVDEQLNRSDIRSDPLDGSVKEGVPVRLEFHVSRVAGSACTPLNRAVVDVWQCDALGMYLDVRDINGLFNTRGKKFLRGYQMADASGTAQFVTIYPGWYPGELSTSISKFALILWPNGALSLRRSCTSMMPSRIKCMRRHPMPPGGSAP